ncbi:MAG: alpha/beta fold hydrolase [Chloroflexota bacterium]
MKQKIHRTPSPSLQYTHQNQLPPEDESLSRDIDRMTHNASIIGQSASSGLLQRSHHPHHHNDTMQHPPLPNLAMTPAVSKQRIQRDVHPRQPTFYQTNIQRRPVQGKEIHRRYPQSATVPRKESSRSNRPLSGSHQHQTHPQGDTIQRTRTRFGRAIGSTLSVGLGELTNLFTYGPNFMRRGVKDGSEYRGNRYQKRIRKKITIRDPQDRYSLSGMKYELNKSFNRYDERQKLPADGKAVILFSGSGKSNADQLGDSGFKYVDQGATVYGIDYRGFGDTKKEDGSHYSFASLSEARLYEDGMAIYKHVRSEGFAAKDIILHGFSLGGAVASKIAKRVTKNEGEKIGGLILESSIDTGFMVGARSTGWGLPWWAQLAVLPGIFGLLGGSITKGASGDFNTVGNLKKLSQLDPDLPLHIMSGSTESGDQLSLGTTGLHEKKFMSRFNNFSSREGSGKHLSTLEHMNHMHSGFMKKFFSGRPQEEDDAI